MASHGIARSERVRTEEQRQQDLIKIYKYQQLENDVRSRAQSQDFSIETFDLTTRLLRLNPEYYTIWNVRRRCITSRLLSELWAGFSSSMELPTSSPIPTTSPSTADFSKSSSRETQCSPKCQPTGKPGTTADGPATESPGLTAPHKQDLYILKMELVFTIPLLMDFPKCYWIWDHRIWALEQTIKRLPAEIARTVWEEELALDSKMLIRDRRNFHAWGYRQKLTERLESAELLGSSMAEAEFDYTTLMINADLSNFSAWHRRAMLIPRILAERTASDLDRLYFLDREFHLAHDALNVGPEDQSLWYYHQILMLNVLSSDPKKSFAPRLSVDEACSFVEEELEFIHDLRQDFDDVKWIHEALLEYTPYVAKIQGRELKDDEKAELAKYLDKLEKLDPMRNGRWKDTRKSLGL